MRALPAIVLLLSALPAAAAAADSAKPSARIGIGLAKPPYIMESGKAGLEYEIAEKALAAAGVRMVPVQLPPARGLAMFRAGQLDGLLTVDRGIGSVGHFSDAYIDYQNVAVTLARRGIMLSSIGDLARHSMAGFQNAHAILGEEFRAVTERHAAYKEHAHQLTQVRLLYAGRVDVAVGDRLILRYFSRHLGPSIDATQPVVYHNLFPLRPRHAVFRDSELRDRFNEGLRSIRASGTYDAILKKYQAYMQP